MNILSILALAGQIYGAALGLVAGTPVTIKTYIGKQHVSITLAEIA